MRKGRSIRVIVAPDSFKGSLSAPEVAEAIAAGWSLSRPTDEVVRVPLADGGEGTVGAIVDATGGEMIEVEVTGPWGQSVAATFGLIEGGKTAVIEMAAASGLHLRTDPPSMDAASASSFGTGQLISDALNRGAITIVLGLGGSATNDGGAGMLGALGVHLLDKEGVPVESGGHGLGDLHRIDTTGLDPRVADCRFVVASDVSNPLCGSSGATAIFGPQKGIAGQQMDDLDRALAAFALLSPNPGFAERSGAGSAGGVGFAAIAFLGAEMQSGIGVVMDLVGLDDALEGAALLITGEGRVDSQTMSGKTPFGAMKAAERLGVPTIAIVGSVGPGSDALLDAGMVAIFDVVPRPVTLEDAVRDAAANLRWTARNVAAVWSPVLSSRAETDR